MSGLTHVTTLQQARAVAARSAQQLGQPVRQVVRELLADGPLTLGDVVLAAAERNITEKQVTQAVRQMVSEGAGLWWTEGTPRKLSLMREARVPVLPVKVQEFKPLRRDPFAAWRLCERDPVTAERIASISHKGSA